MIWPFTELSALRARELDYNRQIVSLTTRLEVLTQENFRLHAQSSQYIDDLRKLSNLTDPPDSHPDGNPDDLIVVPMMRAKVNEVKESFLKRNASMDMLDHVAGFYKRAVELNNGHAFDSLEASEESSTS